MEQEASVADSIMTKTNLMTCMVMKTIMMKKATLMRVVSRLHSIDNNLPSNNKQFNTKAQEPTLLVELRNQWEA